MEHLVPIGVDNGAGRTTSDTLFYCDSLLLRRQATDSTALDWLPDDAVLLDAAVVAGDLYYRVESTNRVELRTSDFVVGTSSVQLRRIVVGSDSLLAWLQATDTLAPGADIALVTELVIAANGTVVWRDDTISARDLADGALDEIVPVPVDTLVAEGTKVFFRVRAVPANGLVYTIGAVFHMMEDSTQQGYAKRTRRTERVESESRSGRIAISAAPNPASDRVRIRVESRISGDARLTLHDVAGTVVTASTITFDAARGVSDIMLDLRSIPSGAYTVRIQLGHDAAALPITVVR